MRVSSATLKRAAQTPSGTPDLLCHPVKERTIYTSRPLTCSAAAPIGYSHLLLCPSPIAAGLFRVHAEDNPCAGRVNSGRASAQGRSHSLGRRSWDPVENHHDWGLPWLQWMATSSAVPCRALCAPHRLLSPPS